MKFKDTKELVIEIRKLMLEKNINIKELSKRMDKKQATVSALLRQDNITFNMLLEIVNALECDLNIEFVNRLICGADGADKKEIE